jgi:hypothetical protein
VPENTRRFDARPRTGAQNQIEVAYAATTDADERLIRTGLGPRYIAHLENFRSTKGINDHCLHVCLISWNNEIDEVRFSASLFGKELG